MTTTFLELLAPARDKDTAIAAINAGADAVFIGGPAFGARAAAGNSAADLKEVCDYAHRFNAKVHVTLNTLLYDKELEAAQQLIYTVKECGADALIVQDPVIFTMDIPAGLELHASTQCDISTPERLQFYADMGVSQAVLARELSLQEIKEMHERCPKVRLEAFVAGALCVGQSGICHISEFMQGRSANRGSCAQICRLPMQLFNKKHELVADSYLLSLKDNFALRDLPDLIAAGVTSFKIEGRLKDIAYVRNLTATFSQQLDKIVARTPGLKRSSGGEVTYNFVPNAHKTFSRGFTDAYLHGDNTDLCSGLTPKSAGTPAGTISKVRRDGSFLQIQVQLHPGTVLHNGDAFTYFNARKELTGFRADKAQMLPGHKQAVLTVRFTPVLQRELVSGLPLSRNYDIRFMQQLTAPDATQRVLPLDCEVTFADGTATVCYKDGFGRSGSASMQVAVPAGKENAAQEGEGAGAQLKPLSAEFMQSKAQKTGSKTCRVNAVEVNGCHAAMLTASAFNALRREAFTQYESAALKRSGTPVQYRLPDPLPRFDRQAVDKRLILNARTAEFYRKCGVNTDLQPTGPYGKALMVCKNCLIKNHALCTKEGGSAAGFYLRIGNKNFPLLCDCKACKMLILPEVQGKADSSTSSNSISSRSAQQDKAVKTVRTGHNHKAGTGAGHKV